MASLHDLPTEIFELILDDLFADTSTYLETEINPLTRAHRPNHSVLLASRRMLNAGKKKYYNATTLKVVGEGCFAPRRAIDKIPAGARQVTICFLYHQPVLSQMCNALSGLQLVTWISNTFFYLGDAADLPLNTSATELLVLAQRTNRRFNAAVKLWKQTFQTVPLINIRFCLKRKVRCLEKTSVSHQVMGHYWLRCGENDSLTAVNDDELLEQEEECTCPEQCKSSW